MGLFNNFPYMDLSNLNLDFILKKLKDLNNYVASAAQDAETAVSAKDEAVAAKEAAQLSAENAASSEENAGQSAESAQNYAEHIADPVGGLVTNWLTENIEPTTPPVDSSLSIQGAAADAKKTGDELNVLRNELSNSVPYSVRLALDTILHNVGFKNDNGYIDELVTVHAWAVSSSVISISAAFNPGSNTIYTSDTLEDLRQYLTVTASYSDGTSGTISGYALSGNLNEGSDTITVSYEGRTTTFNVVVHWGYRFTGSDLIRGYLSDSYSSTDANDDYCTSYEEATPGQKDTASKRLSMATFIPIEYGYSYIYKWKATKTLMLSAFAYSEAAMTKYENREEINISTERASLSNGWNAGTNIDGYQTVTGTPTQLIGGSPVATTRFNFKTDPEVAFSEDKSELTEMILTREVAS